MSLNEIGMQLLIVYIVLALAIVYAVYAVVKNIRSRESNGCQGCSGCDLKKELLKNYDKKPNSYSCPPRK